MAGELCARGRCRRFFENRQSTTIKYLIGECAILRPDQRRELEPEKNFIEIKGCRENNLKNNRCADSDGGMICVTGVSGSGNDADQSDAPASAEAEVVSVAG